MKSKISFDAPRGKVVIIEGLPGVGKSTLLHDLYKSLHQSYPCECYREETSQPLDLFRQAMLPTTCLSDKVEQFLKQCPKCRSSLEQWISLNSYVVGNYSIVAYTQINAVSTPIKQFATELKCYDVGEGRCPFEEYASYHKIVWRNFAKNIYSKQNMYLAEGALFHNQLFDLIGFYQLSDSQLCEYYKSLLSEVDGIDIKLVFIQAKDTTSLLHQTCQTRTEWFAKLEQWLAYAPWAKDRAIQGESGMLALYDQIQSTHLLLQNKLGLQVETFARF